MLTVKRLQVCALFILLPYFANAFSSFTKTLARPVAFVSSSRLYENVAVSSSLGSRYYQLEEMEDKDSCTTEVFLSSDGSVTVGMTNGPLPVEASGTWEQSGEDGALKMTITRTYSTGMQNKGDLGEFQFSVSRSFVGAVGNIGGSFGVTGDMHLFDETLGDLSVGYFSMIDTTDAKLEASD